MILNRPQKNHANLAALLDDIRGMMMASPAVGNSRASLLTVCVSSMPRLEVLSAVPAASVAGGAPILFVHGAFCGAWVWQEHFLPFFAERGCPAYAVSLRGHGTSEGYATLRDASLADYIEDVRSTAAELEQEHGRAPVLVGHSMGGMVVQRVIESYDTRELMQHKRAAAMVLMSSVPPGGLLGTSWHMMLKDPWLFWQMGAIQAFGAGAATVDGVHRAMFTGDAPVELTAAYLSRLQEESMRVQFDLSTAPSPVSTNGKAIPTLVIGAEEDNFVPAWMAQTTARHYTAPCRILPREGHAMMLSHKWTDAAGVLAGWLAEQGLCPQE